MNARDEKDLFQVIELAAYGSEENAMEPRRQLKPIDFASSFLRWMLKEQGKVLAVKRQTMSSAGQSGKPWVLSLEDDKAIHEVTQLMADGFSVDVAVPVSGKHVVSWFEAKDFRVVSTSLLKKHDDAVLLAPSVFEQRLAAYKTQGCAMIVLAGHDMDPIYIIECDRNVFTI